MVRSWALLSPIEHVWVKSTGKVAIFPARLSEEIEAAADQRVATKEDGNIRSDCLAGELGPQLVLDLPGTE
jgi:hypothetical protein